MQCGRVLTEFLFMSVSQISLRLFYLDKVITGLYLQLSGVDICVDV